MKDRDFLELEIKALAHDGAGIGFEGGSGKAIFVPGALPGQIARCKITTARRQYCRAEVLEICHSPYKAPACPHWHECGGCPLMPMEYEKQLEWKARIVSETLVRIGKIDPMPLRWASYSRAPLRNKVEFAFGKNGRGELIAGYRKRGTHSVFEMRECGLLPELATNLVAAFVENARRLGIEPDLLRLLTLRKSVRGWHILCLSGNEGKSELGKIRMLAENLLAKRPELAAFAHEIRRKHDFLPMGERRVFALGRGPESADEMIMNLGDLDFSIDIASFFQVNNVGANALASFLHENDCSTGPMLDLYCGSGSPGLLLAARHEACLGIEQDKRAVSYARRNAKDEAGYKYMSGAVEQVLPNLKTSKGQYAFALCDPPRSGMDANVIENLLALAPGQIIYISCNPATFARDASFLREGYRLENLSLVDMFPDTAHIECCSVWKRR